MYHPRLFEWVATLALMGSGAVLILWPSAPVGGAFHQLIYQIGLTPLLAIYTITGWGRLATLIFNEKLGRYTHIARATFSVMSAVIWLQLGIGLTLAVHAPSPSVAVFAALVYGELSNIRRARGDYDGGA
jgi:hypothetical protein